MITVLAGGVGAARLLRGLVAVLDPREITVVVNTADDFVLHGLHICPDIDTIRYTLSHDVGEFGWGRANESWTAMDTLEQLASQAPTGSRASDWFRLGDRDLAVHLYRTQRLHEGATLTDVTAELRLSADLQLALLPMSNEPVATMLELCSGETIDFQEYFVARRHDVPVAAVRLDGIDRAKPAPRVLDAIANAERIVIAPSNPIVSIGPVLAVPGIADAIIERRSQTIAVSPIVDGRAIKGPADRLLAELFHDASVVGVAAMWSQFASTLMVDTADAARAVDVEALGLRCVVTPTVMHDFATATSLASAVLNA